MCKIYPKRTGVVYLLLSFFIAGLAHAQDENSKYIQAFSQQKSLQTNTTYFLALTDNGKIGKPYTGFKIVRRLTKNLSVIRIEDTSLLQGINQKNLFLTPANNLWKLSPKLSGRILPSSKFIIELWDSNQPTLQLYHIKPLSHYKKYYIIQAGPEAVQMMLKDDNVVFIDKAASPFAELVLNGMDMSTDKITTAHNIYPDINGDGLTVSIKENLFDTTDVDFTGRYVSSSIASSEIQSHASIMGTIIAGAGNSFYTGKGVAWKSNLTSSDFANLLPDADDDYVRYNVSVQNHSYGTGIENYYGADAAAYDESVADNPSLIHVFSSGNSGDQISDTGIYKGIEVYANLTGSFKMAKNIITVGSIDSFYRILPLSSKGPSYDGRIKPELVAYGTDGSSGAAALVSGISLLLQQAFKDSLHYLPSASLVKALLLNTADDAGTKYVDFKSGYGSANAVRALRELKAGHFIIDSIKNAEEKNYTIHLPANTTQFKTLLCWTDLPGLTNSYKALVNDLDIEIINNNTGKKFLPLVLNSYPSKDSLEKLPKEMRDSLNNTEQVVIENISGGDYTLKIKGFDITSDNQSFSIAYQWDTINRFTWLYPTKGDNLYGGDFNTLRWDCSYPASNSNIEISYDKGLHWLTLTNAVNNTTGYYTALIKDSFCLGQLRLKIANQYFYSDTFTISKKLNTGVGYNCSDSFLLYWDKAQGINNYNIYSLNSRYLGQFATIADTTASFSKSNNATYFAIAPVIDGKAGLISYGFDYTSQGVGCYLKNFLADLLPPDKAILHIELGATKGIKSIIVQKLNNQVNNIYTNNSVDTLSFDVTDDSLLQGLNRYRLQIALQNGSIIYSDIQTVNYLANSEYIIFPNPLQSGQLIKVLTKDLNNNVFEIYSSTGQRLIQRTLSDLYNEIPVRFLSAGIYFYTIRQQGRIVNRGKLLIQ